MKIFNEKCDLDTHKALCHPEELLLWAKRVSNPYAQFGLDVKRLLSEELYTFEKNVDVDNNKIEFYCRCCSTTIINKDTRKFHLVKMHERILGAKLKQIQDNPRVEFKRKTVPGNKTESQPNSKQNEKIDIIFAV